RGRSARWPPPRAAHTARAGCPWTAGGSCRPGIRELLPRPPHSLSTHLVARSERLSSKCGPLPRGERDFLIMAIPSGLGLGAGQEEPLVNEGEEEAKGGQRVEDRGARAELEECEGRLESEPRDGRRVVPGAAHGQHV